jgi:L-alanine-DL-glutamate epimerase-like enolase superfamily enzyme
MHISSIEVVNLSFDYPAGNGFRCAGENVTGRLTSLILVTTSTGLRGIGSAYSHPDLVRLIAENHLAPMLIGEDPREIDRLWQRMYNLTRWYGRKGVAISTLGAIDIALWDIRGQAAELPIYKLLGASIGSVPAYASGLGWRDTTSELSDDARLYRSRGFRNVKMRLGRGKTYDEQAFDAVASAIMPDGAVIVDGSHQYDLNTSIIIAEYIQARGALFFEEPFLPEDIDSYISLRKKKIIPIAAGENEFGFQGFGELLRAGAVDIVQPDASRTGGISECLRIGKLAQELGAEVATHSWSDAVAVTANAHVVAALPNGMTVEVDATGNPFIESLLTEPLTVTGGVLDLGDRPGLGIDLDLDVVAELRLTTPVVPNGHYSDMAFGREHLVEETGYQS